VKRWPRLAVALLCLLAFKTAGAAATPLAELLARVCPAVAQPGSADQVDAWLRAEPERALSAACAAAPEPAMLMRVAEALVELSRYDDARALLAAVPPADGAEPPAWMAQRALVLGLLATQQGQRAMAAPHFARARELLQAHGLTQTRRYARVRTEQSVVLRVAGDLNGAEQAVAQAQQVLDGLGLAVSLETTDVLNARTLIAFARQNLPEAVRLARAEIAMMQAIGRGDDPELKHAWASLGGMLSQMNRHAEAVAAFEQGLRLVALNPTADPFGQLGILQNLATAHTTMGRPDLALPLAERAVAQAEALYGADSPRLVRPLTVLATAHWVAARYGAALLAHRRVQALAERHRASLPAHLVLESQDGMAAIEIQLGDLAAARATLQRGLDRVAGQGDLSYWRGRLLLRLARLDGRQARWADAEVHQTEAAQLIGSVIGPQHPVVTQIHADRCVSQLRQAHDPQACRQLLALLPTLAEAPGVLRFRVHAALAQYEEARGRAPAAGEQHLAALAAAQAAGGNDPAWEALDALSQHLRAQGQPAVAVVFGKQAIAAIEALRGELSAHVAEAERGFLIDKVEVYRRVSEWLAEDGRIDEALDTLRLLKEEEFLDFVQRDGRLAAGPRGVTLSAAEQALLARWQGLQPPAAGGAEEAAWVARARQLLAEMAAAGVPDKAAAWPAPAGVLPGELQVHAISGPEYLTLVLDSSAGRSVQRLAWPRIALGREVGAVLAALARRDSALPQLQALHQRLGVPIVQAAQAAGATRIVLRLDGALRYLPVAALHDGSSYLGERYVVEHRVRPADKSQATPPAPAGTAVRLQALGVTRAVAGWQALPGVQQELCAIVDGPVHGLGAEACAPAVRGVVPGEGWVNEQFTPERLRLALRAGAPAAPAAPATALLHMGSHFDLRPGHIQRSTLLLGDGTRLSLAELAGLDFEGQALVTLSACETGLGGAEGADGREVEGLNLLILRRGAQAVLASLWRVDDASTSRLMAAFYRELRRTEPAEALRRAQAELRAAAGGNWRSPFHWAGFYVTSRVP
jgi:CHAT domain-containing protein